MARWRIGTACLLLLLGAILPGCRSRGPDTRTEPQAGSRKPAPEKPAVLAPSVPERDDRPKPPLSKKEAAEGAAPSAPGAKTPAREADPDLEEALQVLARTLGEGGAASPESKPTAEPVVGRERPHAPLAASAEPRARVEPLGAASPIAGGGPASPAPAAASPKEPALRSPAPASPLPAPRESQSEPERKDLALAAPLALAGPAPLGTPALAQKASSTPEPASPRPPRPAGKSSFYSFFHKSADEFIRFLFDQFPDLVEKGHVAPVGGRPRTVIFFGEDPVITQLTGLANEFDDLGLQLERQVIRPKFIDVAVALEALNMAGVANVWNRVEESVTTNWLGPDGKVQKSITHKQSVYAKGGLAAGASAPIHLPAKVPYIFEMPWTEPFAMPPVSTGKGVSDQLTIEFKNSSSTEKRGSIVAVGTAEDLERIQAFVEQIDRPARLVMIEVQLIELNASKFTDIGLESFQVGEDHTIVTGGLSFPGEPIPQPGIPGVPKDPAVAVPPSIASGISTMVDDSTVNLAARFMASVRLLVRTGDAKVKARPKILALDDRPSILHIGEEIPTFESTGVSRELTGGNFVEQVNRVTTQYVGFTLNMRPKISGENEDEVSLQLEVVANKLQGRQQVFAEDLLGIPNVTRRRFLGQTRVKNHRPIILGGLIQEEESNSVNKVPIVGEIPVLKYLFSRRQKSEERIEVILIITPHILSDKTPDRVASPKESIHFDTFDSVLFNDRHILKGRDVQGIDPITKQPAKSADGRIFTDAEVIDLTLLKVVKDRKLVSKLNIFDEYLPAESRRLGWLQRKYPERSVRYWKPAKQDVYFKAAAIVIENIKELNPDLTYQELAYARREIVLPTTPYRMTLSYDKYKTLKEEGQYILRGQRVDLSPATVELIQEAAESRGVRDFADYVERSGARAEQHGELRAELERLYRKLHPDKEGIGGTDYPGFYRELAAAQIDFMVIATYFQENLTERYRSTGPPNIGTFEKDLASFLKTAVTISQRAKRLRDLESRWAAVYSDEEEEPLLMENGEPKKESQ